MRGIGALIFGLAGVMVPSAGGDRDQLQRFHSRPDLRPPAVDVMRGRVAGGRYVFLGAKNGPGPAGPTILDSRGRLVWFRPLPKGIQPFHFRPQRYRGRPVLTWWEGIPTDKHTGVDVVADDSYRVIARIHAQGPDRADLHEFTLTRRETALVLVYHRVRRDLSSVGGSRNGRVIEARIQEIDVRTRRLLSVWRSLDHIALDESYKRAPSEAAQAYDYLHLNSIYEEPDGNLLVSGRHTNAVYELDRRTGRVLWRLGGKRSSFAMGPGARFAAQHDAQRGPGGTISLFDNEAPPSTGRPSRAILLRLDQRTRTARLARAYAHTPGARSDSQGSVEHQPGGDVFVGWGGKSPWFSEYGPGGRTLFDARFRAGETNSYKAVLGPWRGRPTDRPAAAAVAGPNGRTTVYASWNGATEVAAWQVLAGPRPAQLRRATVTRRKGFETAIALPRAARWVAARAIDRSGAQLGVSRTVRVR